MHALQRHENQLFLGINVGRTTAMLAFCEEACEKANPHSQLISDKLQKIVEILEVALDELEQYRLLEFVLGCCHQERCQHTHL